MRSIRWKVFVPVFVLILIYTVIISTVTSRMTRNQILSEFNSFSQSYVEEIYNLVDQFHESSVVIRDVKNSDTQRRLEQLVSGPMSILAEFYTREQQGELSRTEAQRQSSNLIRELRYDTTNYFWIDNTDYINILLPPNTSVEGSSRFELQDRTGHRSGICRWFHCERGYLLGVLFPETRRKRTDSQAGLCGVFRALGLGYRDGGIHR